jgi:tetratricopeptide (TPR) repeat protein
LAFPVIISPRKTKLIGTNPILRWTPVAGETEYRVKIIGDDFEWGTTVKSKTELIYPTNAPALLPGKTYKLTVTMGAHSSDDEGQPDLGFTILNAEKTKEAREAEKKIGKLKLPETPTKFLIAQLYRDFGLNAEAIEVLKDLPNAANEVAPALELGELYIAIGLNRLAEESYLHALDLAEKADEIFGQSLAEYALGQIYEALGNKDEAIKRWQKAGELCQQLGDDEMVKKIKASLNSLQ